ncbi:MAG: hypothetical protein GXP39_05125 [Chloroflexi bacterium]|nr:hypothetical protein [Chloroflexota bacterium]
MTPSIWMSPRERVEAALLGGTPDMVPFTIYERHLPTGETERRLRDDGLCIVQREPPVYTVETPNVSEEQVHFTGEDGMRRVRTILRTPVGTLTAVSRMVPVGDTALDKVMPWTHWREEYLFKGPNDYEPLEFLIRDRRYRPNYEIFSARMALMGDDGIMRANIGYSPLQEIIYVLMGMEQFAIEWAERRDRVMRLYDALTEDRRKIYPLVAQSPARIANYGGNVSPEVVGLERFERYILPHYDEAAEVLHAHGKLLGVHFDANVRLLAPGIARSKIDYVEAFTPIPGSDMTLAEARAVWPDKILWINFPSSVHLAPISTVEETTRQLLREAAPGDRFIIGITEDVPSDRWQETFPAILRTIRQEGRLPLS